MGMYNYDPFYQSLIGGAGGAAGAYADPTNRVPTRGPTGAPIPGPGIDPPPTGGTTPSNPSNPDPSDPMNPENQRFMLNQDKNLAWSTFLDRSQNYNPDGARQGSEQYKANSMNKYYTKYMGQAVDNPNQGFWDWLQQEHTRGNLRLGQDYLGQSPTERGDSTQQPYGGRARWVSGSS